MLETDEAPKRPRKALAIAAGLALVAGIGGAGLCAFSGGEAPEAVKDAATSVQAAVKGEAKVSISAKADGWTEDLPAFGYAVVDEEGKTAEEGELTPGEAISSTLPDGVYAVSITSIPTKADGVGTWAPPASQMLQVVDGEATPSEDLLHAAPREPRGRGGRRGRDRQPPRGRARGREAAARRQEGGPEGRQGRGRPREAAARPLEARGRQALQESGGS